jgi:hypothetical protein
MLYIFRTVVFYTLKLFPTTAQSLVFVRLHITATYFSHHQGATRYNSINTQVACHVPVNGKHIYISIIQQSTDVPYYYCNTVHQLCTRLPLLLSELPVVREAALPHGVI